MVESQKMDRGSDALKTHLGSAAKIEIRQTRRRWFQEMLGCEAKTEFRYFNSGDQEIAHSLDDSNFLCRMFCSPIAPFKTVVKELNSESEMLTIDRPLTCIAGSCKCCFYQTATFQSGGAKLGQIQEKCYVCVPKYTISDDTGSPIYTVHPPTCLGGLCVNFCAEGNPCGKGCCKASFRLFPAGQKDTDGDAPYDGNIVKKPKSFMTELLTNANAFEVNFPKDATTEQKAMVVGSAIFINAIHFETSDDV